MLLSLDEKNKRLKIEALTLEEAFALGELTKDLERTEISHSLTRSQPTQIEIPFNQCDELVD